MRADGKSLGWQHREERQIDPSPIGETTIASPRV
jgi:hypothetical protein